MSQRIDVLDNTNNFFTVPAEVLIAQLATQLSAISQFAAVFGDRIESYQRQDYGMRELPAMRIYNTTQHKDSENWYINGDIVIDVIYPPQLRRNLLEKYQDTITGALLAQFRRPSFFTAMEAVVPGLNELGKEFHVDKTLGFEWKDGFVPISQITLNFRINLVAWDRYLTTDDRTRDDPFEKTLGDLQLLHTYIQGILDDNETVDVTIESEQDLTN